MKNETDFSALPPELVEALQHTQNVNELPLGKLHSAIVELEADPSWRSEFLKGLFVERILEGMEDLKINQAELSRRWEKSPQYISKLFRQDKRVNFTIETMCELAHLVGRRLDIQVIKGEEAVEISSVVFQKPCLIPLRNIGGEFSTFVPTKTFHESASFYESESSLEPDSLAA